MSDTSDKGAKPHDEQPNQGDTGTERVLDADVLAAVEAAMNGHSGDADVLPEQSPEALRVLELEAQLREVQLRAQAEVQNTQRRAERDVTNAHKFALEKFAGSLLEVVDNLERALLSVPADNVSLKPLQEGLTMTHKLFADTLKRFAVESVDPLGAPFDPLQHQAVSMQPSTTAEPNTVTAVFQKGYTLSGRLLRPAMVVVATAG